MLREHSLATLAQQELERRIVSWRDRRRRQAQRGRGRGGAGRLARAGPRGLQRPQPGRPGARREEPRRLRAPGLAREASEFYEVRAALEGLIGAWPRGASRSTRSSNCARWSGACTRRRRRAAPTSTSRSTSSSTTCSRGRRATTPCTPTTAASSTSSTCTGARRSATAGTTSPCRRRSTRPSSTPSPHRDEQRAEALLTEHVLVSRARLREALGLRSSQALRHGDPPHAPFRPRSRAAKPRNP